MADNWSASPVTLTDAGDWAKWTMTLGSDDADALNNAGNDTVNWISVRMAMNAGAEGYLALIVNDTLAAFEAGGTPTLVLPPLSGGQVWSSAGRFAYRQFGNGPTLPQGIASLEVGNFQGVAVTDVAPWVAGNNVVRLLWYGKASPFGDAEPIEIDFVAIQAQDPFSGVPVLNDWFSNSAQTIDLKPVTAGSNIGYDDHVDPDPLHASGPPTWILEGGAASTGTADIATIEVVKYCPPRAAIRVTSGGDPVSGVVGAVNEQFNTSELVTLDGAGEATFTTVSTAGADSDFWYGGSDDWGPAVLAVDGDTRLGCGAWYVGHIGMAS